ncbi:MAG: polyketide synthase dehydratase domain-containing protein [Lentisphaerae bacterium]|nr:polyketide synthase dehydratase domain-containing protein [Lentisphaerota bacterium]
MPKPEQAPLAAARPPRRGPEPGQAGRPGAAEQALGAYFETMGAFLAAQRRFVDRFVGAAPGPAPSGPPAGPRAVRRPEPPGTDGAASLLLGRMVEHEPGTALVCERVYGMEADTFLQDHTLASPRIAYTDPALRGLPVMPLTVTLEMLAEAACALCPGKVVTELRDVAAARWITFERGARRLRVSVRRAEGDGAVFRAAVHDAENGGDGSGFRPALAEAVVVLADAYPAAAGNGLPPLAESEACGWRGEAVYPDRLFHGPRLRAVHTVRRWAADGTEGTLRVPPRAGLFRAVTAPVFATDPVLLDAAGAFVGLWSAPETYRGVVPFPFRVARIRLYAPPPPEGAEAAVRHRVTARGRETSVHAIDVVLADGTPYASIEGWEDRFFDITPAVHRVAHRTLETRLCDELALPPGADGIAACITPALPDSLFEAGFGIWETTLAFCLLNRAERETWLDERATAKRRRERLLGRAAAKDAVRRFLAERYGVRLAAADVEIAADARGKPYADGPWRDWIDGTLELSIAHSGGAAVAAVADGAGGGIGIDLEQRDRRPGDGVANGAFTETERELLERCGGAGGEWLLRFWCAKEALGKALGTGLRGNPRGIIVTDADPATGEVGLTLTPKWADVPGGQVGRRWTVRTWVAGNGILALARGA